MIGYIALLICFALAYLKEASHDARISSFPQTKDDNIAWHKEDWQYIALIGFGISIFGAGYYPEMDLRNFLLATFHAFLIGTSIATLKILVFNIRINKIFGNAWNYVGENGIENKFKGKETLYYALALLLFLASSGFIILAYVNILK